MRFQIDADPDETRRACAAITGIALPRGRSTLIIFALYAAVIIAAYLLTPTTFALTTLIGIVAVLGTPTALQADARTRLRRLQSDDPHARETHFVEVSDEGVRAWCAHVDARYPWAEFTTVTETSEFFLLVRGSGAGSAIPKRVMETTDVTELRDRLRQWTGDRAASLVR